MAGDRGNSPPEDAELPIGAVLKRLRRQARLTGQELGRRAGMSQAKISKIETGAIQPSTEDVQRLAHELGASPAELDNLLRRAEELRDHMLDWRLGRRDPATWQHEIAQLEAAAREL